MDEVGFNLIYVCYKGFEVVLVEGEVVVLFCFGQDMNVDVIFYGFFWFGNIGMEGNNIQVYFFNFFQVVYDIIGNCLYVVINFFIVDRVVSCYNNFYFFYMVLIFKVCLF